ncbi:MAG: hypothetical protein R2822_09990 [Spirosomataceae bacterium]
MGVSTQPNPKKVAIPTYPRNIEKFYQKIPTKTPKATNRPWQRKTTNDGNHPTNAPLGIFKQNARYQSQSTA